MKLVYIHLQGCVFYKKVSKVHLVLFIYRSWGMKFRFFGKGQWMIKSVSYGIWWKSIPLIFQPSTLSMKFFIPIYSDFFRIHEPNNHDKTTLWLYQNFYILIWIYRSMWCKYNVSIKKIIWWHSRLIYMTD